MKPSIEELVEKWKNIIEGTTSSNATCILLESQEVYLDKRLTMNQLNATGSGNYDMD